MNPPRKQCDPRVLLRLRVDPALMEIIRAWCDAHDMDVTEYVIAAMLNGMSSQPLTDMVSARDAAQRAKRLAKRSVYRHRHLL